ncbi:MAG TPA: PAS domain S-box protein, partial [Terriglobia bacterium]|nr:PAS domain S-box protein [Terriglobia bacterium]
MSHTREALFREYFELGLIGMAITSPEKGCIEVNDEICRILGYERHELLQLTWAEITHPDDLALDLANFEKVIAGKCDGYSMEKRWIRKDGHVVHTTISVKCLRRPDGSVASFIALLQDITARKQAEEALSKARDSEIAAMNQLHDFSTRLTSKSAFEPLVEEILRATVALQNADFGLVQLYNPEAGSLGIIALHGFNQDFLEYFEVVHDGSTCGQAMQTGTRVIIEDVETNSDFAPYRQIARSAGFRAVQSTPLMNRSGQTLGVLSTLFRKPHRPSDRELRLTDLYAVQAAGLIEARQIEVTLRHSRAELQSLTAKLIGAQEAEGKHLARELHDVFSQRLAALGMELSTLVKSVSGSVLEERLPKIILQLGDLSRDIHRISHRLHPAILDDLGLVAALRNECIAFSDQYGIAADFISNSIPNPLPEDVSLCLYRVAQESLTNIGKHSNSTSVRVVVSLTGNEVELEVSDFGRGFYPESVR